MHRKSPVIGIETMYVAQKLQDRSFCCSARLLHASVRMHASVQVPHHWPQQTQMGSLKIQADEYPHFVPHRMEAQDGDAGRRRTTTYSREVA